MPEPRLLLSPEMVERATESFVEHGDMERAIRAAFYDVPLSNYAIGTLLSSWCSIVVVVPKNGGVGAFVQGDTPEDITTLGARARFTFDRSGRPSSLSLTRIEWPAGRTEADRAG